jgi:hypothetical protein
MYGVAAGYDFQLGGVIAGIEGYEFAGLRCQGTATTSSPPVTRSA